MVGKGSAEQSLGGFFLFRDLFDGGIVAVGERQAQARKKVGVERRQLRVFNQFDGPGEPGQLTIEGAAKSFAEGEHLFPAQVRVGFKVQDVFAVFEPDFVADSSTVSVVLV